MAIGILAMMLAASVQSAPAAPFLKLPDWARRPSDDVIARAFPERAQRLGVSGVATMSCTVTAKLTLEACSVVSETPPAYGFGNSALYLSRYYRLQPKTLDGLAVVGGQVEVSIDFPLPLPN